MSKHPSHAPAPRALAAPSAASPGESSGEAKETARIEAFSDGVFAIAITLLILELKVPRDVEPGHLTEALMRGWPSWLAFLTSFATVGIMWVNHHRLFTLIRRSDERLILWNTLLLLCVTIVPFPTAVLAEYLRTPDARAAVTLYTAHSVFIAVAFTLLWRHAAVGNRLLRDDISASEADAIFRQYRFGPLIYGIAVAAGLVQPLAGLGICAVLAVVFASPPAIVARHLDRRCNLNDRGETFSADPAAH